MELEKYIRLSMFVALGVVLNIIEGMIPIFNTIPGIKLGLANTITLAVIYIYNFKDALFISIIRVLIVSILRTGIFSLPFLFSMSGSLFSVIMMNFFKKTKLSIIGVSIIGSIAHSVGQILVAVLVLKNLNLIYYFPFIILSSLVSGIIIGILSKQLLKFYKENID